MKKALLALVIIGSVLLTACGASAVEAYMTKDIEAIGVEQNMDEAGAQMEAILGAVIEKVNNGEEVDWEAVNEEIHPVLTSMKETRDKVAQISITDAKVKEINSYLVSTYDYLISGYRKLIDGFRIMDEELINAATDDLNKAQEEIQKWYDLIAAEYEK